MKYLTGIPVAIPRMTDLLSALVHEARPAAARPEKVLLTPEQARLMREEYDHGK
jgi:hypothetical protein